jgi:hypothetical protein
MNINFHYHTIKAAAIHAGFPEEDAQTIASYSQFVDDYSQFTPMHLKNIPTFAQHLAQHHKAKDIWEFHPITTGFENLIETTRLLEPENQKNILIPFHFIPTQKLNTKVNDRRNWRVQPTNLENTSEPSLIRDLLIDAKQKYQTHPYPSNLIRIGILLHIYADTYAHQGFSGYRNWENYSYITQVTDNTNNTNITKTYRPFLYYLSPAIGHANVGHAVDDTNISFTMKQKAKRTSIKYSEIYHRNNTQDFLYATHQIINYLRSCLQKEPLKENEWDILSEKFTESFFKTYTDQNKLDKYWKTIFPNINFQYNKHDLYTVNNHFFFYNIIADEIIQYVNGKEVVWTDFKPYEP